MKTKKDELLVIRIDAPSKLMFADVLKAYGEKNASKFIRNFIQLEYMKLMNNKIENKNG